VRSRTGTRRGGEDVAPVHVTVPVVVHVTPRVPVPVNVSRARARVVRLGMGTRTSGTAVYVHRDVHGDGHARADGHVYGEVQV
jgi:hypothetical protein